MIDDDKRLRDEFDLAIRRLDRLLSVLIGYAKCRVLDKADRQTLKHHAEDMVGAGNKMLELLKETEPK